MDNSKGREPWLALLLSIIFPGLGQIYYGRRTLGILIVISYTILCVIGIYLLLSINGNALYGLVIIFIALLLFLYSHVDSFFTSRANNSIKFENLRRSSKDTWFAVFLNYFIPGIGNLYLKKWIAGVLILLGFFLAIFIDDYLDTLFFVSSCYVVLACWLVYRSSESIRDKSSKIILLVFVGVFIRTLILDNTDIVKKYFYQPFTIPSGGMAPTLIPGDHVLVNKYKQNIEYGDVIVFIYPNAENEPSKKGIHYIKRVVGKPGDSIDFEGRNLVINGELINLTNPIHTKTERLNVDVLEFEENIFGISHKVQYKEDKQATTKGEYLPVDRIPDGQVFVLGDNRDYSKDSRYWGFVPTENIIGKAYKIHWSWDLSNKNWLYANVRWDRISKQIE